MYIMDITNTFHNSIFPPHHYLLCVHNFLLLSTHTLTYKYIYIYKNHHIYTETFRIKYDYYRVKCTWQYLQWKHLQQFLYTHTRRSNIIIYITIYILTFNYIAYKILHKPITHQKNKSATHGILLYTWFKHEYITIYIFSFLTLTFNCIENKKIRTRNK